MKEQADTPSRHCEEPEATKQSHLVRPSSSSVNHRAGARRYHAEMNFAPTGFVHL